jgi:23S rRNA pseudouridine1911/1915/1917 synthase
MSDPTLKIRLLTYIVRDLSDNKKGNRVDHFLALQEGLPSRSQLKSWFEGGAISRGGKVLAAKDRIFAGDQIDVAVPEPKALRIEARDIPLKIVFEDEDLLVIEKQRGLSMHPGASHDDQNTLVHALMHHSESLSDKGGMFRPGIVHRLDKDTEGLVVVAKNNSAHENLSVQFANRSIDRAYWAVCYGKAPENFEIEAPIGRHPRDRKKMAVVQKGRTARTLVQRLGYFSETYSWIRCKLFTGRTHQIRVHLSHKGFPILNDPVYGRSGRAKDLPPSAAMVLENLKGQCLVAYELGFEHPRTHERMHFELEKPEWLKILTEKH